MRDDVVIAPHVANHNVFVLAILLRNVIIQILGKGDIINIKNYIISFNFLCISKKKDAYKSFLAGLMINRPSRVLFLDNIATSLMY